jgi:hypothetical protein
MYLRFQKQVAGLLIFSSLLSIVALVSYSDPLIADAQSGTAGCAAQISGAIASVTSASIASAITGVPSSDKGTQTGSGIQAGSGFGTFFKDCILIPLAKAMAQRVLANITNSLVTWIQTGFHGSPGFVTNIDDLISNSANEAIGQYINGSALSFLCQPFSLQVRIALANEFSPQQYQGCTLSQINQNIKNFGNTEKAWNNWLQVSTEPANNQYGAYVETSGILSNALNAQANKLNNMVNRNGGFLDYQVCDSGYTVQITSHASDGTPYTNYKPATASTPGAVCGHWTTTTPGKTVSDALGAKFGSEYTQIGISDDIDQILGALVNEMVNKTITGVGGLLGGHTQTVSANTDLSSLTSGNSISNTYNSDVAGAADLLNVTNGATNIAPHGGTSASSLGTGSFTSYAIDNDSNTTFVSGTESSPSFTLDLRSPQAFNEIHIVSPYPTATTLGSVEVEVSNSPTFDQSDASTKIWDSISNMFVPIAGASAGIFNSTTSQVFIIAAPVTAQYVRVVKNSDLSSDGNGTCSSGQTDSSGNCSDPLQISEIQVLQLSAQNPSSPTSAAPATPSVSFSDNTASSPTTGSNIDYQLSTTPNNSPARPISATISFVTSPANAIFGTYSLTQTTNGQTVNIDSAGTLMRSGSLSLASIPSPTMYELKLANPPTSSQTGGRGGGAPLTQVGVTFTITIVDANGNTLGTQTQQFTVN